MRLDPLAEPIVWGEQLSPMSISFWRRRGAGALWDARRSARGGTLFDDGSRNQRQALDSARENFTRAARIVLVMRVWFGDLKASLPRPTTAAEHPADEHGEECRCPDCCDRRAGAADQARDAERDA